MTLIRDKNIVTNYEHNREEELKLIEFSDFLKEISRYLMLNHSGYMYNDKDIEFRNRESNKTRSIARNFGAYIGAVILIVGENVQNKYVDKFVDILGDVGNLCGMNVNEGYWSCYKENDSKEQNYRTLEEAITDINTDYSILCGYASREAIFVTTDSIKIHIIFWNLFLCALNDDIYNEQLPLVIELAHCFKLDEHIVADICRAVEYVLSGKKLSEDCDLHCETVECAKFFLGHE